MATCDELAFGSEIPFGEMEVDDMGRARVRSTDIVSQYGLAPGFDLESLQGRLINVSTVSNPSVGCCILNMVDPANRPDDAN